MGRAAHAGTAFEGRGPRHREVGTLGGSRSKVRVTTAEISKPWTLCQEKGFGDCSSCSTSHRKPDHRRAAHSSRAFARAPGSTRCSVRRAATALEYLTAAADSAWTTTQQDCVGFVLNYALREYANDVVYTVKELCDESGRAGAEPRHRERGAVSAYQPWRSSAWEQQTIALPSRCRADRRLRTVASRNWGDRARRGPEELRGALSRRGAAHRGDAHALQPRASLARGPRVRRVDGEEGAGRHRLLREGVGPPHPERVEQLEKDIART